jgi:prolyl oligopeptidase
MLLSGGISCLPPNHFRKKTGIPPNARQHECLFCIHIFPIMKKYLPILFSAALLSACGGKNEPQEVKPYPVIPVQYPTTAKVDTVDDYHGTQVADPYRWLEDEDAIEVRQWIEAENKVTFGYLDSIPFRSKIKARLEEIWNYPKYTAPFREGENYFHYKNDGLQNQSVLYKSKGMDGAPEVFLDPNTLSADGTTSLASFSVSKNGKYAAYSISKGGSDWNEFFVMDVDSKQKLSDHIEWTKFSGAAWKDDGFYYGRYAQPKEGEALSGSNEHKKIYYHKIGDDQSKDKLVFETPEHPLWGIYPATTEDERFLLYYLSEGASDNNALYVQDLSTKGPIVKVVTSFENSFEVIDNLDNWLLVQTNKDAPRSRVVKVDINNPSPDKWVEVIPQQEEVLTGVSYVGGKLFAQYLKDASSRVYIYSVDGKREGEVQLPGLGTVSGFSGKKEDKTAFYTFTSFIYPSTIFKYDVDSGKSEVFRKSEVKFNPDEYEMKQVFFDSKDGTKVPMFIVHKKGIVLDGNNPTFLYGYGGFNVNVLPAFSTSNIVLLENGGVYAVVTLRGGGEYGDAWHKGGMLDKKQNVFDDFIGAAEYLIAQKYTSPARLAIHGRSNGGLLVGAVMCQRPELFGVAFPGVGVMDMLRYHKFTIGHAWAVEYGSSDVKEQFEVLHRYSPLHNLRDGTRYPATMVTTADHDDRVVPAHSFKFAARLQEAHKGENPVLIRIETMAGHGAGKPTGMVIAEQADIWSFMFYNMNVKPIYP